MSYVRIIAAIAAAAGATAIAGSTLAQQRDQPRYASNQEINAKVAKTTNGLATFWLPTGPDGAVVLAHRDAPGHAEIHMKLNDEFVVYKGRADVLIGERLDGGAETAPGEWRGGSIVGGKLYPMGPGDVLWIPAGLPHQVMPKGGDFTYLSFKYEHKPQP